MLLLGLFRDLDYINYYNIIYHTVPKRNQRVPGVLAVKRIMFCSDIHARFENAQGLIDEVNPDAVICCGDFSSTINCSNITDIPDFGVPFYFIPGNHENEELKKFDNYSQLSKVNKNVYFVPRPSVFILFGVTFLGLGGNYGSSDFDKENQKKWHYSQRMFDEAKELSNDIPIDILLTHESPIGIRKGTRIINARPEITDLVEFIQPKYAFFGHHHAWLSGKIGETTCVGLPMLRDGFWIINVPQT